MARRLVKNVTIDSLGNINPKVVGVVSTGNDIQHDSKSQNYFKRNYLDVLRKIAPAFYFADDQELSGVAVNVTNQLINSHLTVNNSIDFILGVSSLTWDRTLSALNTPTGFSRFFFKQNFPATIASDDFERTILRPLGARYSHYGTSSAFLHYVSGTLLGSIPLVATGHHPTEDLATLTASSFANDSSGTYAYLVRNLGWLYFLNREATTWDGFNTSATVATLIAQNLWRGRTVELADSLNIFQEYLWRAQSVLALSGIIPTDYLSGTSTSAGMYTSGSQLLERLKTLNEVVYSPHYLDVPDRKVEEAFVTYLSTSALITDTEEAGDFTKFCRGISFSLADRVTEGNEINVLYDIANCPDQYLELLAELIGWRLIGADVDKWRVQLRNAVQIYKKKGTRKSIQVLLDTLFSADVFDATTSSILSELWESYIPDIIYYTLATSSEPFRDGFTSYTPELANAFAVPYSRTSIDTNIRSLVDRILFDLVREFPTNFILGKNYFPTPRLVFSGTDNVYLGPYHIHGKYTINPSVSSQYMTGREHTGESENLELKFDPDFTFHYRNKVNFIPPFEKRQYYDRSQVSPAMIDRLEALLTCYGVDKAFAQSVCDYIRSYTSETVDPMFGANGLLFFTKAQTHPPNHSVITKHASKERHPDPLTLLTLWNGKSSHFYVSFDASSFDWNSVALDANSAYSLKNVQRVLDEVVPAHAIPETVLTVSTVSDEASGLKDNDCREVRPNFTDLYTGSSMVTTNFGACCVDMAQVGAAYGITNHKFVRSQVENINDPLFASGATGPGGGDFAAVRRNSLRRRNYHFLLPETKMFTRTGRNNPGSLELSTTYYSTGIGYIPLGFIPSALDFQPVALWDIEATDSPSKFTPLIDRYNLHAVWGICENLLSKNSYFGYNVSNTFASRAKQDVTSSDCNTYGRRSQLPEILYMMNKLNDKEKYLQASSIVSGYLTTDGEVNSSWPATSPYITPNDLSAWYAPTSRANVVRSVANQLINNNIADESLSYMENFAFGRNINRLFSTYITPSGYGAHPIRNNYNEIGGPNIFSHTYGPLIYNADFDVDGSAIVVSSFLQTTTPSEETDISFYGGSGVLSLSGCSASPTYVGTIAASDSNHVYLGYQNVSSPEFRNEHLVSAIELVDTSSPFAFTSHPIFTIYRLARRKLNKYDFDDFLVENTVIKYQRPLVDDVLPRLRIKLNYQGAPSEEDPGAGVDTDNKARNFLTPDHMYEINIDAHNLSTKGTMVGGQALGVWIHTEPEDGKIWNYRAYGDIDCGKYIDGWEQMDVSTLNAYGISIVPGLAEVRSFPFRDSSIKNFGKGGGMDLVLNKRDIVCWDSLLTDDGGRIIQKDVPPIVRVSDLTKATLSFHLSTYNNKGSIPPTTYLNKFGPVHRKTQKYVIEIFALYGDNSKIMVFEKIALRDKTNAAMASIPGAYGDLELDEFDLKTTFRYWKGLDDGIASRNHHATSGTMEVSGGGRLNYRSNVGMYIHSRDTAMLNQLTELYVSG